MRDKYEKVFSFPQHSPVSFLNIKIQKNMYESTLFPARLLREQGVASSNLVIPIRVLPIRQFECSENVALECSGAGVLSLGVSGALSAQIV